MILVATIACGLGYILLSTVDSYPMFLVVYLWRSRNFSGAWFLWDNIGADLPFITETDYKIFVA
jgi:hypothetical protein